MLAELMFSLALTIPPDDLLARASTENKPVVVLFRTDSCKPCDEFERETVVHPTIVRRLPNIVFGIAPSDEAGLALFDRTGRLYATWGFVPATTNFGIILDSIVAVAPHVERAASLSGADAQLEIGTVLALLGRTKEARAALARARLDGSEEARQAATVTGAILDANDGDREKALRALEPIAADAATPQIAADARKAIDAILRASAPPPSEPVIRVLPLGLQAVRGRQFVRTRVTSAAVTSVEFSLDGAVLARDSEPPFGTHVNFGAVPERHSVRAVAFDRKGREVGRSERIFNEAGETFWMRLTGPRSGPASGMTQVTMDMRVPVTRRIRRVVVSWNEAERAVLTRPPWESNVHIPQGRPGVLRAVAELDDGRTAEDAVLLNASGFAADANVQLVELPLTIPDGPVDASALRVREGNRLRPVEALAGPDETPLTVGLLMDVSDSVYRSLPDLQEAAIQFLRTTLREQDRAFLITFDTRARLVQAATNDVDLLQREIMRIRPDGLTALYDAMVLGLLQFEGVKGRRAMVVFTDGLDRTSGYRASDVSELARRRNLPIHVIEAIPVEATDGSLVRIAKATGGNAYRLETLAELPGVYARIGAALRMQMLAFIRTDPAARKNEWRPILVDVKGRDVEVHAPAGYYATW